MDFVDVLTLVGGLALFLFGMNVMSKALEQQAEHQLKSIMGRLAATPIKSFLLGFVVTALVQSSSATTVMVVGFVNSGLLTLGQSVYVILGANLGAAITPFILSLAGISGASSSGGLSILLGLLKPSGFTPIVAVVGIILFIFIKGPKRDRYKNIGLILLGFSVLMYSMELMSGSVSGLAQSDMFGNVLKVFSNPILGLLIGIVFTAIIQSSGASIGVLQALTVTGGITNRMAIPILMGQNIGTCITALLSSIGASRNARRAALIHLMFNLISAAICIVLYYIVINVFATFLNPFLDAASTMIGIALINIAYKVLSLLVTAPFNKLYPKMATALVREKAEEKEQESLLDTRLITAAPAIAVQRSIDVVNTMVAVSFESMKMALSLFDNYDEKVIMHIEEMEEEVDRYEDHLGTYLVKLSGSSNLSESDGHEITKMLRVIGDVERISDHAVDVVKSMREYKEKNLQFGEEALEELKVMSKALGSILDLTAYAFLYTDISAASRVEPLEQVIDYLKAEIKRRHTLRLQNKKCTIEHGFVLSDLLISYERVSDHCSNIAGCVIEISNNVLDMHEYLRGVKSGAMENFDTLYQEYKDTFSLDKASEKS